MNWNRIAAVVGVGGTVLAVITAVLGGFLPSSNRFAALLYQLAVVFPFFQFLGVAVIGGMLWMAWTSDRSSSAGMIAGSRPEDGLTNTAQRVDAEKALVLDDVACNWYQCQPNETEVTIRDRLAESATCVLRTRHGLEPDAAREAVSAGTWTDDRVAAAFLATNQRQPLFERLRAAVDPGAAFHRRVQRTVEAIETRAESDVHARTGSEGDR